MLLYFFLLEQPGGQSLYENDGIELLNEDEAIMVARKIVQGLRTEGGGRNSAWIMSVRSIDAELICEIPVGALN